MKEDQASPESLVRNSDIVLKVYGYWPSFHDAEIVKFCLRWSKEGSSHIADAVISIHHWGQDNPSFECSGPDCIIEFLCRHLSNANIQADELAAGGWVEEIQISKRTDDGRLTFDVRPLSRFDVRFDCNTIEVVGIYPYSSNH